MTEICDNCSLNYRDMGEQHYPQALFIVRDDWDKLPEGHRCRADESTCVDGKDCPDYVENCECPECCKHEDTVLSRRCGVDVCYNCGDHKGRARCYCGWAASGGNGWQELAELGENVDDDW